MEFKRKERGATPLRFKQAGGKAFSALGILHGVAAVKGALFTMSPLKMLLVTPVMLLTIVESGNVAAGSVGLMLWLLLAILYSRPVNVPGHEVHQSASGYLTESNVTTIFRKRFRLSAAITAVLVVPIVIADPSHVLLWVLCVNLLDPFHVRKWWRVFVEYRTLPIRFIMTGKNRGA